MWNCPVLKDCQSLAWALEVCDFQCMAVSTPPLSPAHATEISSQEQV